MAVVCVALPLTPYDQVPYDSFPCAVSHPDRLAAIAHLFGLNPAPVTSCRVLELGCGTGANLVPVAASMPGSQFTGVDLSSVQIEIGRRDIQALGLANISLDVGDITSLPHLGTFDFVIAHGVFSWVPREVQEGLLRTISRCLARQGIAFVSYSALPGAHARLALRDILLERVHDEPDPARRVSRARRFAEFVAQHLAPRAPQAQAIVHLIAEMGGMSDAYVLHDYLSEHHEAFTVSAFVARAGAHGLEYLADAEVHSMFNPDLDGTDLGEILGPEATQVEFEQLNDALRGRSFRSTLLCRTGTVIDRGMSADRLAGLFLTTPAQPRAFEDGNWMFRLDGGELFGTPSKLVAAALDQLVQSHPKPVSFGALLDVAAEAVSGGEGATSEDREFLGNNLIAAYLSGQVELATWDRGIRGGDADPPKAFPYARLQASRGDLGATNLWHRRVEMSAAQRKLLATLDGVRTRDQLQAVPGSNTDNCLTFLAREAFLVG